MPPDPSIPDAAAPRLSEAATLLLGDAAAGFALTRGAAHVLVYANAAFRRLTGIDEPADGRRVADVWDDHGLSTLLDRAFNEGVASEHEVLPGPAEQGEIWSCSVWPLMGPSGRPDGAMIEVRAAPRPDLSIDIQRQVAERLLLGALREMEAAAAAEAARERAAFLAEAGRELAESVDEEVTREAVSELRLPGYRTWCFVDVLEPSGGMHRLAIVHPDPAKQAAARDLEHRWSPAAGDPFGAPAVLDSAAPVAICVDVADAVRRATRVPADLRALDDLGVGSLLTVPMRVRGRMLGAITFVGGQRPGSFGEEEIELAQALALRSAVALDNARMYAEALALKAQAQEGSRAKSEFLAHMSHELRTPLNAIGGFVDIIDMGIHGPVTVDQRADLDRIRASQQHLLVMINDILNFMEINRGRLDYHPIDLNLDHVVQHVVALVAPLVGSKQLTMSDLSCDPELRVRADPDRTQQILINLLSNSIKFTPAGGSISIEGMADGDVVRLSVIDTGIGIPPDRLETVFEPFVQVESGLKDRMGGVGLGLAISRDLARAMGGDLTVESEQGKGSRFSLTLPRVP